MENLNNEQTVVTLDAESTVEILSDSFKNYPDLLREKYAGTSHSEKNIFPFQKQNEEYCQDAIKILTRAMAIVHKDKVKKDPPMQQLFPNIKGKNDRKRKAPSDST